MNLMDRLKGFFSLKKGGDSITVTDNENALSATMKTAIPMWWNAFQRMLPHVPTHENFRPLPMAYTSTATLARLVTSEIKLTLADERLNKYVSAGLLPQLDKITQLTLAGGYTVIKPYITTRGSVAFSFGTSRDFEPIAFDENGQVTEGIFRQRIRYNNKTYERREHHTFRDGIHRVTNSAWIYGTKHRIQLSDIPCWAAFADTGEIPSDIPMIVTFRTPYANNIDLDSPLPVSMYANAIDTLHEIDAAHSEYIAEFNKTRAKVFGDMGVFKDGKITDDYFVNVAGDGTRTLEQQIMVYSPPIREEQLAARINKELRIYEMLTGFSSGTFSLDPRTGAITATQVISEDKTTYNTVGQIQKQLRPVLEALAKVTETLARFYGLEAENGEPSVEFGDSVFEDTGTEFARRMQMTQAGILRAEELLMWYFGVPEEKAREMMPDMTQLFGGDE